MEQMETLEINPHIHDQLIFQQEFQYTPSAEMAFSVNSLRAAIYPHPEG